MYMNFYTFMYPFMYMVCVIFSQTKQTLAAVIADNELDQIVDKIKEIKYLSK